nr:bromodomain adjacent to zinc finger domain protein 1A-like [Nicotiana tomentosiformis]
MTDNNKDKESDIYEDFEDSEEFDSPSDIDENIQDYSNFEDMHKNKREKSEGKLGGDDQYFDSSAPGSECSDDEREPVGPDKVRDAPARNPSKKVYFDTSCKKILFELCLKHDLKLTESEGEGLAIMSDMQKMVRMRTTSTARQEPEPPIAATTKGRGRGRGRARGRGRGRAQPRARATTLIVDPQIDHKEEILAQTAPVRHAQVPEGFIATPVL